MSRLPGHLSFIAMLKRWRQRCLSKSLTSFLNADVHRKKRKPNLRPYTSPDDERMTVSFQKGLMYNL